MRNIVCYSPNGRHNFYCYRTVLRKWEKRWIESMYTYFKKDTPPILLVDTTYANEGSSPIDKETGKHIQRKIEWQDPETRKCYRSIILQTW